MSVYVDILMCQFYGLIIQRTIMLIIGLAEVSDNHSAIYYTRIYNNLQVMIWCCVLHVNVVYICHWMAIMTHVPTTKFHGITVENLKGTYCRDHRKVQNALIIKTACSQVYRYGWT